MYGDKIEDHEAIMTASTGAGTFKTSAKATAANIMKGHIIHKMAAKSLIRDLEEGRSYLHDVNGVIVKGTSSTVNQKIIETSIRYQIMSKKTAFVAVEKREETSQGEMKLRKMEFQDPSELKDNQKNSPVNLTSKPSSSMAPGSMLLKSLGFVQRESSVGNTGSARKMKKKKDKSSNYDDDSDEEEEKGGSMHMARNRSKGDEEEMRKGERAKNTDMKKKEERKKQEIAKKEEKAEKKLFLQKKKLT